MTTRVDYSQPPSNSAPSTIPPNQVTEIFMSVVNPSDTGQVRPLAGEPITKKTLLSQIAEVAKELKQICKLKENNDFLGRVISDLEKILVGTLYLKSSKEKLEVLRQLKPQLEQGSKTHPDIQELLAFCSQRIDRLNQLTTSSETYKSILIQIFTMSRMEIFSSIKSKEDAQERAAGPAKGYGYALIDIGVFLCSSECALPPEEKKELLNELSRPCDHLQMYCQGWEIHLEEQMIMLLDQFKGKVTPPQPWIAPQLDESSPFEQIHQLLDGIAQDLKNAGIPKARLYPEVKWIPQKLRSQIFDNIETLRFIFKFLQTRNERFIEHPLHNTDTAWPTFKRIYSLLLESMTFNQSWDGGNVNHDLFFIAEDLNKFIYGPNAPPISLSTLTPSIPVTLHPQDPTTQKIGSLFKFAILALLTCLAVIGLRRLYFRE